MNPSQECLPTKYLYTASYMPKGPIQRPFRLYITMLATVVAPERLGDFPLIRSHNPRSSLGIMSDSMELEVSPATTPEELKRSISSEKKSESSKASPTADEINDMGGQDHAPQDEQASHDEHTYLPAVKMYSLLGSLILVFFLVLMDMSIVTTV